jgi:hypothetical protein
MIPFLLILLGVVYFLAWGCTSAFIEYLLTRFEWPPGPIEFVVSLIGGLLWPIFWAARLAYLSLRMFPNL